MKLIQSVLIFFLATFFVYTEKISPLSDRFIDNINEKQSLWRAGRNFDENTNLEDIYLLGGVIEEILPKILVETKPVNFSKVPDYFDAREKWKECSSISEIKDQANCGSCWAVSAASAMSDRICIHSQGKKQVTVSAMDLLSCCRACGQGCSGGLPRYAWHYWMDFGIVSGGDYNSKKGCKTYFLPPCEHHVNGSRPQCKINAKVPKCQKACDDFSAIKYEDDLTFGESVNNVGADQESIKAEIFQNGPVEATYKVYSDFLHYKSGVYNHVVGDFITSHAVKIIGWGTENSRPYWLVANTWNDDWGDKGYFKILRGKNECGIESGVVTGIPKL